MLDKIRGFDLKKAGYMGATIGILNIALYILVLFEILPYTWVNGDRTESMAAARDISSSSILLTIVNILII